jgi:hypothetical protein
MENFLIDSYTFENIHFTKPKKNGDYLVSKVKYNNLDFKVQFPKMSINNDPTLKNIELEFISESSYNKKVYNFLSRLDEFIVEYITSNTQEWFGKKIPSESICQMYNKFIKAPKTSENKCTINFSFNHKKNILQSSLLNKKNEELDLCDLKKEMYLECISQLKYIIFSKDNAFVIWEICTAKVYNGRVSRVPGYGFIEDPEDQEIKVESDEELDVNSFF